MRGGNARREASDMNHGMVINDRQREKTKDGGEIRKTAEDGVGVGWDRTEDGGRDSVRVEFAKPTASCA